MTDHNNLMERVISLCKRRGFVFPASEIYGGFANAFDYGPLGAAMKKNIKDLWWKRFVTERDDIVGLDSAIIQNPKTWEASGHLSAFTEPLIECLACHARFREDHFPLNPPKQDDKSRELWQSMWTENYQEDGNNEKRSRMREKAINSSILTGKTICPRCFSEKGYTSPKNFNLMFKTYVGVTEDSAATAYLRPETAQGIFLNFKNILQSSRVKVPFGIAQIGKAFRNEITPGNFIFRTREFEQGEIEFFVRPSKEESEKWYQIWLTEWEKFFLELGIKKEKLTIREHAKEELSHYSSGTSDLEYDFPFGVSELAGVAQRTDFDLKQHAKLSGQDLNYFDETTGEKFIPYVVEPTMGIDRAMLAFIVDGYDESDGSDGREAGEITLRLNPKIAPIKAAVFPLVKKEGLPEIAQKIVRELKNAGITTYYDESGSVGRRYRRQDEIGTPWCITVDFDSIKDDTVTLRDRDTMKQERVKIEEIERYIVKQLATRL